MTRNHILKCTNAELSVMAERVLQNMKGFTAEHDDKHTHGQELISNAVECLSWARGRGPRITVHNSWGLGRKHQRARRRLLVIAAALIIAEIERRDRRRARLRNRRQSGKA